MSKRKVAWAFAGRAIDLVSDSPESFREVMSAGAKRSPHFGITGSVASRVATDPKGRAPSFRIRAKNTSFYAKGSGTFAA